MQLPWAFLAIRLLFRHLSHATLLRTQGQTGGGKIETSFASNSSFTL